jgi:hypothetical protein
MISGSLGGLVTQCIHVLHDLGLWAWLLGCEAWYVLAMLFLQI